VSGTRRAVGLLGRGVLTLAFSRVRWVRCPFGRAMVAACRMLGPFHFAIRLCLWGWPWWGIRHIIVILCVPIGELQSFSFLGSWLGVGQGVLQTVCVFSLHSGRMVDSCQKMAKLCRKQKWLVFFWDTVYILFFHHLNMLIVSIIHRRHRRHRRRRHHPFMNISVSHKSVEIKRKS